MPPTSLTVIIPAYNEQASLREVVRATVKEVQRAVEEWEVLIVDDGSEDDTRRVARDLATAWSGVRVVGHESNLGSGAAIRTGIENAACELVMYVPADGQFLYEEIPEYVAAAERGDIVLGVRDGRPGYTAFRLISSHAYGAIVNFLFGHRLTDVNWVNLWRRSIFDDMSLRSAGVFMMEEIVARTEARGGRVVEIPSGSLPREAGEAKGGRLSTILRVFQEMLAVWFELKVLRTRTAAAKEHATRNTQHETS